MLTKTSGPETSNFLQNTLIPSVYAGLHDLYSDQSQPSTTDIENTIQTCFINLDQEILTCKKSSLTLDNNKYLVNKIATQGSCALLAFHESKTNTLRIALTGDSRAVLGRRIGTSRWLAKVLSVDQAISNNASEEKRVKTAHPSESIIENNRIMGDLAVSRAFGDARFKWTAKEIAMHGNDEQMSRRPEFSTPPYVIADPVLTSVEINPEKDDFLILGSDGMISILLHFLS